MTHKKTESEYIRLSDAARLFQVYPATILRWADRGLVPAPFRCGSCVLFERQPLIEAVTGKSTETVGGAA